MFLRGRKSFFNIKILIFLLVIVLVACNYVAIGKIFYPFPYQETVYANARVNNIDPYLLAAIVKTESNFNPQAVSSQGAIGLMQIMPETALWVVKKHNIKQYQPEQLFQAETNVKIGSLYVAELLKEFNNDPVLTLAAYNAGRGNVMEWLNKEHWTGEHNTIDQIPFSETRQYIRRVTWHYKVYQYLYKNK